MPDIIGQRHFEMIPYATQVLIGLQVHCPNQTLRLLWKEWLFAKETNLFWL